MDAIVICSNAFIYMIILNMGHVYICGKIFFIFCRGALNDDGTLFKFLKIIFLKNHNSKAKNEKFQNYLIK